jgi:glucose/arabinose dehydrogenase
MCFVIAVQTGLLAVLVAEEARAQSIQVGRLRVELERIVNRPARSTLDFTVFMDTPNDGTDRLFFLELGDPVTPVSGRIRVLENGSYSTFLDLSGQVYNTGETGLLGFTFHPDYANAESPGYRKLYTYHSVPLDPEAPVDFEVPGSTIHHQNVLTEWQVDANNPNVVDVSTRREIFRESHIGNIHAGGMLEFGTDGYLRGSIGTPPNQLLYGQDTSNIFGTIFRIDPLAPELTSSSSNPVSANGKYRIPANNPFVGHATALPEIYAYGVRSPYRFSTDTETGLMFLGDVGQFSREEVAIVQAGDNLGWPYREGSIAGPVATPTPAPILTGPIAEYTHADGKAIIGGYVYRGSIPALQGKYIFGEWAHGSGPVHQNQGRLFWIDPFDDMGNINEFSENQVQEIATGPTTCASSFNGPGDCTFDAWVNSFSVDDDGELYIIGWRDNATVVYKLTDAYFLSEGDYNQDGVVDAADYTVWRDTVGSTTNLRANGDDTGASKGIIDSADFAIWKTHFGESISGGAASLSVPEPTTLALLLMVALSCSLLRKHRRRLSV